MKEKANATSCVEAEYENTKLYTLGNSEMRI